MLRRLERVFAFRPGELQRGLLLFAYLFLVLASFVVGKAVRDALFLDEFGALLLPYADIAVAVIVGVWVSIYLRVASRVGVRTLLVGSLVFFSLNCLLFWVLLVWLRAAWLTPVFYVWVGMFGVVAPAQVWTLANYLLTTREAKRLFGFVGSGATAGWIVGGFITGTIARRFGAESTLLLMTVALLAAAGLVLRLWQVAGVREEEPAGSDRDESVGLQRSLRIIGRSPYLRAIAAVILLSSFATSVAGWQFKALADRFFEGRDQLAAFFGAFNFYAGLLSFAMQWLLTGRLLRRLGLGFTLFVVPVSLALGTIGLLLFGTLAAVIVLRGSDQVLRYAVDKPTVELLYLPVPVEQTLAAKSFIDTVVWRFGDGLAGLTVLLFAGVLHFSAIAISWVTLLLLGGWLVAAWIARRQYVVNLQDSIQHYRLDAERAGAAALERTAAAMLTRQLSGSDSAEVLYALSLLGGGGRSHRTHPAVRGLLAHESPAIRAEAIRVLDESGDSGAAPAIEKALYDADLSVRTRALLYAAHHTHIDPLDRIEQLGDFEDFSIRAAMITFLAHGGEAENLEAARLLLDRMLADEEPRTRLEAARLLELLPDRFEAQIRHVFTDGSPAQVRHAIRAVGRLRTRRLAGRVIERLGDDTLAPDAIEALAAFGDRLVGTLRDSLVDSSTDIAIRRQLPAVLQRIGSQAAYLALAESLLDPDAQVRFGLISALNKLRDLNPGWPLDTRMVETVLGAEIMGHYRSYQILGALGAQLDDPAPVTASLRDAMERELERIFRLMKLLFPSQDLHSAYVGVQSTNPVVHDNALEFLDNVLQPDLRRILVPLLDSDVRIPQRVELANRVLGTAVDSSEEAVTALLRSDDPWLQSCGVYAVGALRLSTLAPELDRFQGTADPLLRESVRQARLQVERKAK